MGVYRDAHPHSICNRSEILRSDTCACFYCLCTFDPREISGWIGETPDDTAVCPRCSVDSVLGSAAGFPLTPDFLRGMHKAYFQ